MTMQAVSYDNVVAFKPKKQNNKIAGKDSEVYAFKSRYEIASMIKVLDKHINEASNDTQRNIAYRNKMLFVIGINVGVRASDLRTLKWSFFFDEHMNMKDSYKFVPLKTSKQRKFVKISFNNAVKQIIKAYTSEYPVVSLDDYLFTSRKGSNPVTVDGMRKIIKEAAVEAGITQNIGSHSLRKTFGFWCWHESSDKNKALVILQQIFNHSSTQTTAKYIGILDEEIKDMFDSIDLGLDMI